LDEDFHDWKLNQMSFSSLKLVYEPFSPLCVLNPPDAAPTRSASSFRGDRERFLPFLQTALAAFDDEERNWIFFAASLLIYFHTKKAIQKAKSSGSPALARLGGCSLNRAEPFSCVHPRALWGKAEALIRSESLSKDRVKIPGTRFTLSTNEEKRSPRYRFTHSNGVLKSAFHGPTQTTSQKRAAQP
jgi:hypothetical protein